MDADSARDDGLRSNQAFHEPKRSQAARPRLTIRLPEDMAGEPLSTIREMSRDFGVSTRALRFYEDRGLLQPHREGATRLYDPRQRRNLKMILKAKQLGFTLAEISDMLRSHGGEPAEASGDPRDVSEGDLELPLPPDQIIAQIFHLERQRRELDAAIVTLRDVHRRLIESPCRAVTA